MQELDASKAPGPDGMPARFLKMFYAELAHFLLLSFRPRLINYLFLWTGSKLTFFPSLRRVIALCATITDQYP